VVLKAVCVRGRRRAPGPATRRSGPQFVVGSGAFPGADGAASGGRPRTRRSAANVLFPTLQQLPFFWPRIGADALGSPHCRRRCPPVDRQAAWPFWAVHDFIDAPQKRDAVARRVNFPAVRRSPTEQIVASYLQVSGKDAPLASSHASPRWRRSHRLPTRSRPGSFPPTPSSSTCTTAGRVPMLPGQVAGCRALD